MNQKIIGILLIIVALFLTYLTWRGIFVTRAGMINVAFTGAVAGACYGGAFTMFRGKK